MDTKKFVPRLLHIFGLNRQDLCKLLDVKRTTLETWYLTDRIPLRQKERICFIIAFVTSLSVYEVAEKLLAEDVLENIKRFRKDAHIFARLTHFKDILPPPPAPTPKPDEWKDQRKQFTLPPAPTMMAPAPLPANREPAQAVTTLPIGADGKFIAPGAEVSDGKIKIVPPPT